MVQRAVLLPLGRCFRVRYPVLVWRWSVLGKRPGSLDP